MTIIPLQIAHLTADSIPGRRLLARIGGLVPARSHND